ncbi:hypothetical protein [Nocardioides ochotonae]|uniref:hypothetical protein n=1 Tax=Nocardioides ochotonae TaxID=2685869 RepID=UPI001407FD07|nr:hypothetical protein [Nocardioides ochotonae]
MNRLRASKRWTEDMRDFRPSTGARHYIRTKHALELPAEYADWGGVLREARPVASIEHRVVANWESGLQGAPYIGVMIRANGLSHPKTLESSPVSWYLDSAEIARRELDCDKFFLSTDSAEAANQFVAHFPNTVTVWDKGRYNSKDGVADAIADLYLLAASTVILGPYWSSFVTMAEKLAPQVPSFDSSKSIHFTGVPTVATDPLRPWDGRGHLVDEAPRD